MPSAIANKEPEVIHINPAGALVIDLSQPRTIAVTGINRETGAAKNYLLKVTQSGKLLLL